MSSPSSLNPYEVLQLRVGYSKAELDYRLEMCKWAHATLSNPVWAKLSLEDFRPARVGEMVLLQGEEMGALQGCVGLAGEFDGLELHVKLGPNKAMKVAGRNAKKGGAPPPLQPPQPSPEAPEPSSYNDDCMAAAAQVADILRREAGTGKEALAYLSVLCDSWKVSAALRKSASCVGGIPVRAGQVGFKDMPACRDPGNAVYARAVEVLLVRGVSWPPPLEILRSMGSEKRGDVLEALLGAAAVDLELQKNRMLRWRDLVGGSAHPDFRLAVDEVLLAVEESEK
jgi:hypothetical protein